MDVGQIGIGNGVVICGVLVTIYFTVKQAVRAEIRDLRKENAELKKENERLGKQNIRYLLSFAEQEEKRSHNE